MHLKLDMDHADRKAYRILLYYTISNEWSKDRLPPHHETIIIGATRHADRVTPVDCSPCRPSPFSSSKWLPFSSLSPPKASPPTPPSQNCSRSYLPAMITPANPSPSLSSKPSPISPLLQPRGRGGRREKVVVVGCQLATGREVCLGECQLSQIRGVVGMGGGGGVGKGGKVGESQWEGQQGLGWLGCEIGEIVV